MLLLDGGVSLRYDGEAGTVIAMTTMRDFLLRASWPSNSPQLLYWESNLLKISPPPTLFPINLFLGEVGVCKILKDVEEISKILFPFAAFYLLFAEKRPSAQQRRGCRQGRAPRSATRVQTSTHRSQHLFMSRSQRQVPLLAPARKKVEWRSLVLGLWDGDALQPAPGFPGSA